MNREVLRQALAQQNEQPFFLYDLDGLAQHLRSLQTEGVELWYATKANPLSAILRTALAAGFGIDCASRGEWQQALRSVAPVDKILLTGPAKSPKLLREALHAGLSCFVLESLRQAEDLNALCTEHGIRVRVLLRIQLSWNQEGKSVLGGSKTTPFGIAPHSWLALKKLSALDIIGVHSFQWGNILDTEKLQVIWTEVAKEALQLSQQLGFTLQVLDLGGGLGIPYKGEPALAWPKLALALQELRARFSIPKIWLELGRYAVGPYGSYVATVVDRKEVNGQEFLVLEGGVHHLLRPAIVGEPFPATLLRESGVALKNFQVHGPLCTALDCLGGFDLPSDIAPGDALVFAQTGAYGFTESMPFFLCHDLPAEWVYEKNALSCLRPTQSAQSWLH